MTQQYCHSPADVWYAGVAYAQVNERMKIVRFRTAAATRDAMEKKHKEAMIEKAMVRDRANANALFDSATVSTLHLCTCVLSVNPWVCSCPCHA